MVQRDVAECIKIVHLSPLCTAASGSDQTENAPLGISNSVVGMVEPPLLLPLKDNAAALRQCCAERCCRVKQDLPPVSGVYRRQRLGSDRTCPTLERGKRKAERFLVSLLSPLKVVWWLCRAGESWISGQSDQPFSAVHPPQRLGSTSSSSDGVGGRETRSLKFAVRF